MVVPVFLTAVCTLLGILTGLGLGGGNLLIPLLLGPMELEPAEARALCLLFYLPAAVLSSVRSLREGTVSLQKLLPAIVGGALAAILCSRMQTDSTVLRRAFGALLTVSALREFRYRAR